MALRASLKPTRTYFELRQNLPMYCIISDCFLRNGLKVIGYVHAEVGGYFVTVIARNWPSYIFGFHRK